MQTFFFENIIIVIISPNYLDTLIPNGLDDVSIGQQRPVVAFLQQQGQGASATCLFPGQKSGSLVYATRPDIKLLLHRHNNPYQPCSSAPFFIYQLYASTCNNTI